jgi:phosphopantothenoylcysteine synthetase/decarboxylase
MRPILLVGGAPRVTVDAVRFLSVRASGRTAVHLATALGVAGARADLLLSVDACVADAAERFSDRSGLEEALRRWIARHPDGVMVLSAAVNDYQVARVDVHRGAQVIACIPGAKIPSGADELVIRLRPASKIIDQVRAWGLRGALVGFKYEDASTVVGSAQALFQRVGAALVVANSLTGTVQALVDGQGVQSYADRGQLLDALTRRLLLLAG